MPSVEGYELEDLLHSGLHSRVYRGRRLRDGLAVVVKMLDAGDSTLERRARLRREYELLRQLDSDSVVRVHALERHGEREALVLEDFGGRSLREDVASGGQMELERFLQLALRVTAGLSAIHASGVVHRDIKPSNILINEATRRVVIADFSISSQLSREQAGVEAPTRLEGTLAYMAPEQTGRMNRSVDYRSDYYSLGVTFYQLLTGTLPFTSGDPSELVHAHIALIPTPPHELRPALPEALSRIVLKLMEKSAEARYQSARGLMADLERCLTSWSERGEIELFEPGQEDISERFQIPERLYGREAVVDELDAAFERCAAGAVEVALVTGEPGIGKSAVAHELLRVISGRRGLFGAGKFEQLGSSTPHAGLAQALRSVLAQLLSLPGEEVASWRELLSTRLGAWSSVLTALLPELEQLLGVAASPRSGADAESQLQLALGELVRALGSEEHPLVLFLDDLQWAEHGTLRLLEATALSPALSHALILAAYRDHEIDQAHPLLASLERVAATLPVARHHLEPLARDDARALVRDTLTPSTADPSALADLIHAQTSGNPFFTRLSLRALHDQGLVSFDATAMGWRWELDEVRAAELCDDMAVAMSSRLAALGGEAREILELASCIGGDFNLELLALSLDRDPRDIARELLAAVQLGLVRTVGQAYKYLPSGDAVDLGSADGREAVRAVRYKFQHDRIQQAAYAGIPSDALPELHLRTGRLLRANGGGEADGEVLYALAHHLNLGSSLIEAPEERLQLADLNLRVGRAARAQSAWEIARRHLECGVALLPDDAWSTCYELAFELYRGLMEVEHFAGDNAAADELLTLLMARAQTELQRAELLELRCIMEMRAARHEAMLRTAQEGLATLEFSVPRSGSTSALLREFAAIRWRLRNIDLERFIDGPRVADPALPLAMGFLIRINHAATYSGSRMGPLALLRIAKESLGRGLSDFTSIGFAVLSYVTINVFGDLEAGRRYAEVALALAERRGDPWADASAHVFVGLAAPWIYPLDEANALLDRAYEQAYAAGLLQSAYFYVGLAAMFRWYRGINLESVQALCDRVSPGAHRYGQSFATLAPLVITSRATRCLRGQTRSLTDLSSDDWSEEAFADELAAAGNALALELHASLKAEALYFAGDLRGAERWLARAAEHVSPQTRSSLNAVSRVLFTGLVAARRCEHTVGRERKEQLATLRRAARKIARFRRRNDEDFAAHDLLLKAELARLSGELGRGRELYDAAIEAARGRGSQKLEAIGLELAARASLGQGRELVGELYLRASRRAYVRWGAQAKAEALVREFPAYLTSSAEAPSTVSLSPASSTTLSESIDVSAIVKASRAISSELILESLLRRLITIVVENAGAQRGVVLLDQGGELRVEAEHDVEAKTMRVLESAPIADQVCAAMVLLVVRTHRDIVLDDARRDPSFARDPYITRSGARSVLCTALLYQGALRGVLYLENRATVGVFTVRRLGLVKQLAGQIAISIENARLYQDLARARDRAVAADKAKSQFLLTMSHELRTPLNAVIGYTEIVGEDLDDDDVDAAREDLGKISVGARRLVRTLTSILELTRLESGGVTPQRARVALAPLLDDVVAECEELHADNHNELHTAVADGVPEATESDLVMLRYILFSVLDNGCRFTTDGRVTLRVAAREVDGQPWLRFLVEDTGIGFPAEAAERIFEPFRQADDSVTRTHEGAGVSLAVVRRFCAALGGAIDCRSEVGEGSTFIIDLPAGRPAPG